MLEGAEDVIYLGIAALLLVSSGVLLVVAGDQLLDIFDDFGPTASVELLSTLLLVFVFVELLGAVRVTLRERKLIAEPFLLVGIIASIKETRRCSGRRTEGRRAGPFRDAARSRWASSPLSSSVLARLCCSRAGAGG